MNFRSFDLNLLRVLDALLTERSTVEAGRKIGLSQPAVSAALGRLRRVLGDPLFVRHGRQLDLAETMLAGSGPFNPKTERREFRISGSDFFADLLMPKLAAYLRAMGGSALARIGRSRHVAVSLPTFAGVYHAVAESDLVALLPDKLAGHVAARAGLGVYAPPMTVPEQLITMVWHRRATHNPAHRWLRDRVAELLLPLNEGHAPLPESPEP